MSDKHPIEIKISTVVAIAIILHDTRLDVLAAALKKITAYGEDYYSEECAVIDVSHVDAINLDWPLLVDLLKKNGFCPVAVRYAPAACEDAIIALGLRIDLANKPTTRLDAPLPKTRLSQPQEEGDAHHASSTLVVDTPVRAGQRIYARGGDLIVTAVVNSGAEIIADGHIHVYAPLRGRALAGASGDSTARIFAWQCEAQLVSIAGIYRTFEHGYPKCVEGAPIQVQLHGDKIQVRSLLV